MRQINLLLIFTLLSFASYAQDKLFDNLQGLYNTNDGFQFFDISGVKINIIPTKTDFDAKGIKKIKKNYELNNKNITKEYRDTIITQENLVIEGFYKQKNRIQNTLYYIFPTSTDYVDIIQFGSRQTIDPSIVKSFIDAYLSDQLSKYTIKTKTGIVDSINFVGKTIFFDGGCRYMGVNDIQYKGGEMSWSIFDSKETAEQQKTIMIELGNYNPSFKLVNDTTLNVTFEGIETPARRMIYKTKFADGLVFGKRIICIYYITQKVRGWYVTATLSNYLNKETDIELSPLLEKVMSLE